MRLSDAHASRYATGRLGIVARDAGVHGRKGTLKA
jgi:hypothetical protein